MRFHISGTILLSYGKVLTKLNNKITCLRVRCLPMTFKVNEVKSLNLYFLAFIYDLTKRKLTDYFPLEELNPSQVKESEVVQVSRETLHTSWGTLSLLIRFTPSPTTLFEPSLSHQGF